MLNIKKYIYTGLIALITFVQTQCVYAYDAGSTSISWNGKVLKLNNISGITAYSAYDKSYYGDKAKTLASFKNVKSSFSSLGDTSKTAAQRYTGFAWANSQYNFKISSMEGSKGGYDWKVAPYNINETYNISWRYAGVSKILSGDQIATDPNYTSDSLSQNSSAGNARSVSVWNNATGSFEQKVAYGDRGDVHPLDIMKTNGMYGTSSYGGSGTVRSNKYTSINSSTSAKNGQTSLAQQAFELWADNSEYFGSKYKELAQERAGTEGKAWWEILNRYFQIQGDPTQYNTTNSQSLFFYCVFDWAGKTYYNTYTLPAKIQKNMSPTRLVIRDDQGVVCGNTYRDPIELK